MQGGNESFRFRQWRQKCPPSLNQLAILLSQFDEHGKTLGGLLNHLILCLLECDLKFENPPAGTKPYLSELRKNLYHLLAFITDTPYFFVPPNETQEMIKERNYKLRVIQAKRQIDPTYIPNNLPDEEPDYLSPELYQEIEELNLETIDRKKEQLNTLDAIVLEKDASELTRRSSTTRTQRIQIEKSIASLEQIQDTIRSTQSKQRAEPESPVNVEAERERRLQLLKKMENSLRATNYQRRIRKNILALNEGTLLKVHRQYFFKEILPKMIEKDLQNQIPTKKDLFIFFEKVRHAINLLDDLPIEEGLRLVLKTALERELEERIKNAEAKMDSLEDYEEDAQLLMAPILIKKAYIAFSKIISAYESPLPNNKNNFNSVKKVLRDAQGKIDPVFLANEKRYQLRNPKRFVRPNAALQIKGNPHLDIRYFNSEAREKYRVHLFNGKCYRLVQQNGTFRMGLLNTEYHNSHLKEGWVSFVMNAQGEIFAASHQDKIVHSSFMNGGPVIFAGEMKVGKNGQIVAVTNYSGHYTTQFNNLQLFARHLRKRGVNISSCDFYEIDDQSVGDRIKEIHRSNNQRLDNLEIKVSRLEKVYSSLGERKVEQADSLGTQSIRNELDRARLELMTAAIEKKEAEQSVFQDSERLKYCHRFRFKDNELVPFSRKKTLLIAGLICLSLIGLVLGLGFLGLLIVATHGAALPVIGYGLTHLTVSMSPSIIYAAGAGITSAITVVPSVTALYIGGGFHAMGRGLKTIGQWCMGLFRKKGPPPGPEPTQGTPSHHSTSGVYHQQTSQGISTTFIHGLTSTGTNNRTTPAGRNQGAGRVTTRQDLPVDRSTEAKHQRNPHLPRKIQEGDPRHSKYSDRLRDEEQNTVSPLSI